MADVIGHPWMQGEMPTQKEVAVELSQRLERTLRPKKIQIRQKKILAHKAIKKKERTHLGLDSDEEETFGENYPNSEPNNFEDISNNSLTAFIVAAEAKEALSEIQKIMKRFKIPNEMVHRDWKLSAKIEKEITIT